MSGLSDVRLVLHGDELQDLGSTKPAMIGSAPAHLSRWGLMWHRLRTRRQLMGLNDMQLKDVGLNRTDAVREGMKPFWRS